MPQVKFETKRSLKKREIRKRYFQFTFVGLFNTFNTNLIVEIIPSSSINLDSSPSKHVSNILICTRHHIWIVIPHESGITQLEQL